MTTVVNGKGEQDGTGGKGSGVAMRQVLVASRAGGVGKTTTTTLLADALFGAGVLGKAPVQVRSKTAIQEFEVLLGAVAAPDVTLVDVDVQPGSDRVGSNLARRFPRVLPFALAPSSEALAEDPSLAFSHFDKLGKMLLERRCVVDFGANVIDTFFAWAATADVGVDWAARRVGIDFVAPTTADDRAMTAAADAIEAIQGICLPHGVDLRCIIVLNRRDGVFDKYGASRHWKRLEDLGKKNETVTLHLKKGPAEMWPYMDQALLTPTATLAMTEEEIMKKWPDMASFAARRGCNHLLAWYRDVVDDMIEAGLLAGAAPRIAGKAPAV